MNYQKFNFMTIFALLLILSSGMTSKETGIMLTAEGTKSSEEVCEDDNGIIPCPHFQDEGSATAS